MQEGGDTIKTNDVTIASQCSVNNLYHLVGLLPKWNGPISVGKEDFATVLQYHVVSRIILTRDFKILFV